MRRLSHMFPPRSRALAQAAAGGDRAAEAQVCFSLGNTLALAGRCADACDYHIRHLSIARQRGDNAGLARAAWSLGTAYTAQGEYRKALYFVLLHYRTSKEIGDTNGETVAEASMAELERAHAEQRQQKQQQQQRQDQQQRSAGGDVRAHDAFGFMPDASADPSPVDVLAGMNLDALAARVRNIYRKRSALERAGADLGTSPSANQLQQQQPRRHSADRPASAFVPGARPEDVRIAWKPDADGPPVQQQRPASGRPEEDFFDFLSRMQCKRIDDQRCDAARLSVGGAQAAARPAHRPAYRAADSLRPASGSFDLAPDALSLCSDRPLLACTPDRRSLGRTASVPSLPASAELPQLPAPVVRRSLLRRAAVAAMAAWPVGDKEVQHLLMHDDDVDDDGNLGLDGAPNAPGGAAQSPEAFVDMIVGMQARRMNDQRTELAFLPGLQRPARQAQQQQQPPPRPARNGAVAAGLPGPSAADADRDKENAPRASSSGQQQAQPTAGKQKEEDFLDFVMRLQSHRIEEQRSAPPSALASRPPSTGAGRSSANVAGSSTGGDDFANALDRMQAGRYDDQRTMLPPPAPGRPSSSETQGSGRDPVDAKHRRSLSERLKRQPK